jgi:hypothetical protein
MKRSKTKQQKATLIHSRPSQSRLPPLAQISVGTVAQFSVGANIQVPMFELKRLKVGLSLQQKILTLMRIAHTLERE